VFQGCGSDENICVTNELTLLVEQHIPKGVRIIADHSLQETRPGRPGPFQMEWVRSTSGGAWYTAECLS
jgi:hypothetical protein